MKIVKAHAYGNDFLCAPLAEATGALDALARAVCHRHEGIGADGLILYEIGPAGASMRLLNADGSHAELSGNGLRCLAALVVREQGLTPGAVVRIETDAGVKMLDLVEVRGHRMVFRAALGPPRDLRQLRLEAAGDRVTTSVLDMGNPQCVLIGPLPAPDRFARLGPALATHPHFPAGTNVEFAHVESPDRVRILIWERGVGPTSSSGTGSAAAAVAAAAHGGANQEVDVVAPGGTQRVEWREDSVYLTGWADVVLEGRWMASDPLPAQHGPTATRPEE